MFTMSKSTFINALVGEQSIDTGTIEPGETVVFGKYDQMGIALLNPEQSVLDFVKERVESSTPGMSMAEAPSEAMKLVSVGGTSIDLHSHTLKCSHLVFSAIFAPICIIYQLKTFQFPRPRWNERVSMLSGGERRRLQLLNVLTKVCMCVLLPFMLTLYTEAHIYILFLHI